eukprot:scaffold35161_cov64-Phaeocystis_antarctica.AAC.8
MASVQSRSSVDSISCAVASTSEPGRSILLSTGSTVSSLASASCTLAMVWASTPCDASTTNSAPSHAASERETSYWKSTWPGVSIRLSTYVKPSRAL